MKWKLSDILGNNKPATIRIVVKKGKNQTQPYSVSIDDYGNGPLVAMRERYSDLKGAKRGALRKIGAWNGSTINQEAVIDGKKFLIVFTVIK